MKVHSIVLYKNNCAEITAALEGEKYTLRFRTSPAKGQKKAVYGEQNCRPKDFIVLSEESSSLEESLSYADSNSPCEDSLYTREDGGCLLKAQVREAWELLSSDEETSSSEIFFEELSEIVKSDAKPCEMYGIFLSLKRTVWFSQNLKAQNEGKLVFLPRTEKEIEELVQKACEKGREAESRAEFIKRVKDKKLLPEDSKFMADVEALALGKTDKSRTMHEAGITETPERAHQLLLETGIWDITRNPYPVRWGLSMKSASENLSSPPDEDRLVVSGISYAIDNEWSCDPDDAVAFDGKYLWVHIADPASTVTVDSPVEKSARDRGATLYMPEATARMLSESSLEDYALGLTPESRALSFRILLDSSGNIEECSVFRTKVCVKRYTYQEAELLKESAELKPLFEIARRNIARREALGSVQIDLPEVHISVDGETKKVSIENESHPESATMVREMMLLAGEGAARFAFKNQLPFVYVSQEAPDIPKDIPSGLAGQYRLRKCMKRRSVGLTPSSHAGLGLGMYSQVTSPLRRYGDLISHIQLRSFIKGEKTLDKDTLLLLISAGDAAAGDAVKASRKSELHWKLVYLLQNPEWKGEAVCVDVSGKTPYFMIPSLAMEGYIVTGREMELNEKISVCARNIRLSELLVDFVPSDNKN